MLGWITIMHDLFSYCGLLYFDFLAKSFRNIFSKTITTNYICSLYFNMCRNIQYVLFRLILLRLFEYIVFRPLYIISVWNESYWCWFCSELFMSLTLHAFIIIIIVRYVAIMCFCECFALNRVWYVYFRYKHSRALLDEKWRTQINPNDINWYIDHKSTLGSPRWLFKRLFIPWCIFVVCVMYVYILYSVFRFFIFFHDTLIIM